MKLCRKQAKEVHKTRHARRNGEKRRPCLLKSGTDTETRQKKNKANRVIMETLIIKSPLNSIIANGGHPLCANGFRFRPSQRRPSTRDLICRSSLASSPFLYSLYYLTTDSGVLEIQLPSKQMGGRLLSVPPKSAFFLFTTLSILEEPRTYAYPYADPLAIGPRNGATRV